MHDPIIIVPLHYCDDNMKGLDQWLRWSPSTRFRYISYKDCYQVCFDYITLEEYYPGCETVLSIVNPYTLTFRTFKRTYFLHKIEKPNDFVKSSMLRSLVKNPLEILKKKLNSKPYHILRNEYFYGDLRNLEKKLSSPLIEVEISKETYSHKTFFDNTSIQIINELFFQYVTSYYQDFD
jgi:hypothetical protein